jgi:uncharacterized protein (DUF305 family)
MSAPWFRRTILVLALLTGTGCATGTSGGPGAAAAGGENAAAASRDMADLEALYRARVDSARMRFTEADVRFMAGMIGHHAQAVVMAQLAPARGASPSIRTLAARIINAQEDEIRIMQRWLGDRGQPVPEVHAAGTSLMVHPHDHSANVPGMITPGQMEELAASSGADFDRLFLTRMIEHHRGAVTMVHELFATDGAGQDADVFRFASDVQVDQVTEITRMERMLSALPVSGSSP